MVWLLECSFCDVWLNVNVYQIWRDMSHHTKIYCQLEQWEMEERVTWHIFQWSYRGNTALLCHSTTWPGVTGNMGSRWHAENKDFFTKHKINATAYGITQLNAINKCFV